MSKKTTTPKKTTESNKQKFAKNKTSEKKVASFEELSFTIHFPGNKILKLIEVLKEAPAKHSLDFILEISNLTKQAYNKYLEEQTEKSGE